MDFSNLVQGTRQFFQGHPGRSERTGSGPAPALYGAHHEEARTHQIDTGPTSSSQLSYDKWAPRSIESAVIPSQQETTHYRLPGPSMQNMQQYEYAKNSGPSAPFPLPDSLKHYPPEPRMRRPGEGTPLDLSVRNTPDHLQPSTEATNPNTQLKHKPHEYWPHQQPYHAIAQSNNYNSLPSDPQIHHNMQVHSHNASSRPNIPGPVKSKIAYQHSTVIVQPTGSRGYSSNNLDQRPVNLPNHQQMKQPTQYQQSPSQVSRPDHHHPETKSSIIKYSPAIETGSMTCPPLAPIPPVHHQHQGMLRVNPHHERSIPSQPNGRDDQYKDRPLRMDAPSHEMMRNVHHQQYYQRMQETTMATSRPNTYLDASRGNLPIVQQAKPIVSSPSYATSHVVAPTQLNEYPHQKVPSTINGPAQVMRPHSNGYGDPVHQYKHVDRQISSSVERQHQVTQRQAGDVVRNFVPISNNESPIHPYRAPNPSMSHFQVVPQRQLSFSSQGMATQYPTSGGHVSVQQHHYLPQRPAYNHQPVIQQQHNHQPPQPRLVPQAPLNEPYRASPLEMGSSASGRIHSSAPLSVIKGPLDGRAPPGSNYQRATPVAAVSATVRNMSAPYPASSDHLRITYRPNKSNELHPVMSTPRTAGAFGPAPFQRPVVSNVYMDDQRRREQGIQKPVGVALVSFKNTGSTPPSQDSKPFLPIIRDTLKPNLNLSSHPFPHLAAAAAAATKSTTTPALPMKFRTKAELKQMSTCPPAPRVPTPPPDPVISDEKWLEWGSSFSEWDSFVKELAASDNIKRVCRVTKPPAKKGKQNRGAVTSTSVVNDAIAPPRKVSKKLEDYSSDEDVPLSLRQKAQQAQMRAERLKRRKQLLRGYSSSESSSDLESSETIVDRLRHRRRAARPSTFAESSPPPKSSPLPSGWEGEVIDFKKQLRIPAQLINASRPRDYISPDEEEKVKIEPSIPQSTVKTHHPPKRTRSKIKSKSVLSWTTRWERCVFRNSMLFKSAAAARRKRVNGSRNKLKSRRPVKISKPSIQKPEKKKKRKGFRRRFRSGFDYLRKKKKSSNKITKRSKAPNKEYHLIGSTLDAGTEMRSWVINKCLGETLLHRAAKLGYLEGVEHLLGRPETQVSAQDNAGYTALHVACAKGHLKVAKLLLQHGANESCSAKGGVRPLLEAVENDHIEVVRLLLSFGADPTLATYGGQTPLSLSTSADMKEFLKTYINDLQGVDDHRPWNFHGSGFLMDDKRIGFDPLDSSILYDFEREITMDCSPSLPIVRLPLYQVLDQSLNPWVLYNDVAELLGVPHSGGPVEQFADAPQLNLTRQQFAHIAVPISKASPLESSCNDNVLLVHYSERLKELLNVEQISVSA